MDVGFLVQLTDGGWKYLTAPQSFCDVLHTPHRYTGQVHLYEGLFHTAFPTAVPLYDGSVKKDPLEFGHLQGDVPGICGKVAAVVAAELPKEVQHIFTISR